MAVITRISVLHRLDGTEGLVRSFLKHPQQPHLHGRGYVADFVEEERPSLGQGEMARLVSLRVREGAGLVTEELRLQERVREGAAVDRHEGSLLARRKIVNRPGDQLLARAACTLDYHRTVAGGDGGSSSKRSCIQGCDR